MNIVVYQVEIAPDGSKVETPVTLFSRLAEARKYIATLREAGLQAFGRRVHPFRVGRI